MGQRSNMNTRLQRNQEVRGAFLQVNNTIASEIDSKKESCYITHIRVAFPPPKLNRSPLVLVEAFQTSHIRLPT